MNAVERKPTHRVAKVAIAILTAVLGLISALSLAKDVLWIRVVAGLVIFVLSYLVLWILYNAALLIWQRFRRNSNDS